MKQITDALFFIQGQDEFIPDAHAYVLGHPSSGDLALVDGGLMGKGEYKLQAIQKLGLDLAHIKRVIMTHTHLDHIGCVPEILKALPQAELWVHTLEAGPLERGEDDMVYGMDMFKNLCQVQFGLGPEAFKLRVDRKLEGGETLDIGQTQWETIHIPGHSPGSIGLYSSKEKILIPGDVVYADHAIGRFDLHGASGPELRRSLYRLAELPVEILLPGHNHIVEKVPPGYMEETAREWEPYLT